MSVVDNACGEVRALVMSGHWGPGDRLPELPLAARLRVSRPTVREALRRLESQGLLRSDGRGLHVAKLATRELRSVLLTRASLEGLHAELAARRVARGEIAPASLRRVDDLASAADRSTRAGHLQQAVRENRAFHQAIDALSDSPVGAALLDSLWDRMIVSTGRSLLTPGRAESVADEHRQLLTAVRAGQSDRAHHLARQHVLATLELASPADP